MNQKKQQQRNSNGTKRTLLLFLLIALVLCTLLYFLIEQNSSGTPDSVTSPIPAVSSPDSLSDTSSSDTGLVVEDTAVGNEDSTDVSTSEPAPEVKKTEKVEKGKKRVVDIVDTVVSATDDSASGASDSSEVPEADSVALDSIAEDTPDPCLQDTIKPRVYADPSGGLHRKAISVKLLADKSCTIQWKLQDDDEWKTYEEPVRLQKNATLYFSAFDSCGNRTETRRERYEFDLSGRADLCPDDMEYIRVGKSEFCMDRYEWPNRKGATPLSFVSLYEAMDSCYSVGKRLCTSQEWSTACAGPHGWKYPYGKSYENEACGTRDTTVQAAGSRPECRGYFDLHDMSGNLAEWTSTPSTQNRSFNNVMGGFYESGSQSSCTDSRYSYYPQNRHNPVGFRCCKDIAQPADEKGSRP